LGFFALLSSSDFQSLIQNPVSQHSKNLKVSNICVIQILWRKCQPQITCLEIIYEHNAIFLIRDYLHLSLRHYIDICDKGIGLPRQTVKSFMYQMLQALQYCHERLIIHRNLKPQNVMVDPTELTVKLTDFELCTTFGYPHRRLEHEVTHTVLLMP
uniref:cyclin-dependent kinase n=1 Tax=Hydatigena taeniaeformis TaxID=6205 RepID=A0A0R3WW13_HYDTA